MSIAAFIVGIIVVLGFGLFMGHITGWLDPDGGNEER